MKSAVAHSEQPDSVVAANELVQTCVDKLGGDQAIGGMLFAAIDYDHQVLLDKICDAFPNIALIGCTTDGEVSSERRFCQDSATLITFAADDIDFRAGLGHGLDESINDAVAEAVKSAVHSDYDTAELCFALPAGLIVSATAVTESLRDHLGKGFPIVGGVAADDWRFSSTLQFCGREIVSNGVPILLAYGALDYSIGIASGWAPLGLEATVTSSEGARVRTIDDEPAADFYRRYLGQHVEGSPEYPIAITYPDGTFALRAPFEHSDDGSVLFVGDVPTGSTVQLTRASRKEILAASRASIGRAFDDFPGEPDAAVLFSCAARKHLLGTQTDQEYALLEDRVAGVETCGFYTYGEIAPHERGGDTDFHNQTFIAVLLGSRAS